MTTTLNSLKLGSNNFYIVIIISYLYLKSESNNKCGQYD